MQGIYLTCFHRKWNEIMNYPCALCFLNIGFLGMKEATVSILFFSNHKLMPRTFTVKARTATTFMESKRRSLDA